jgi:hypothetical protein
VDEFGAEGTAGVASVVKEFGEVLRLRFVLPSWPDFFKTLRIMKTTILPSKHSISRSPLLAFLLIPLTLACFGLSPQVRAVCQEGCDTSNGNTFLGDDALVNNTTGSVNTATGSGALFANTNGTNNTATGFWSLFSNTTGSSNTGLGTSALLSNTIGGGNTATGTTALYSNTTGSENTAVGLDALYSNTTGSDNTAVGVFALISNTTGFFNTATGFSALNNNTTGFDNTAIGFQSLNWNITGSNNTAVGYGALSNHITGSNNIALGAGAGESLSAADNNIDIGNPGADHDANTIRIGTTGVHTAVYFVGISTSPLTRGDAVAVGIDSNGRLGVRTSSARYKENIKPMAKSSEAVLSLKPVTFRYRKELDPIGIPQFGLVAEDVAQVSPDLVSRDKEGKPYTVRYEAVNAMLLNEFLKEHRKVEELEANAVRQQKPIITIVPRCQ